MIGTIKGWFSTFTNNRMWSPAPKRPPAQKHEQDCRKSVNAPECRVGEGSSDITYNMTPSDVDTKPSYTEEQKREVLLDLLKHFDEVNTKTNKSLSDSGESKYCSPFERIEVSDIKNYALIGSGFEEF